MGSMGDMVGDMEELTVSDFRTGKSVKLVPNAEDVDKLKTSGHGGGDWNLMRDFILAVTNQPAGRALANRLALRLVFLNLLRPDVDARVLAAQYRGNDPAHRTTRERVKHTAFAARQEPPVNQLAQDWRKD